MDREVLIAKFQKSSSIIDREKKIQIQKQSMDEKPIYIGKPGTRNLIIAMEELSELQQQISKYLRGRSDKIKLIEEIGDVYLALDYVKMICDVSDEEINKAMNVKIKNVGDKEEIYL